MIVFDSTVLLSHLLNGKKLQAVDTLVTQAIDQQTVIYIPELFFYETYNAAIQAHRQKELSAQNLSDLTTLIDSLHLIPVSLALESFQIQCCELAMRHSLSVYDAAYLQIAINKHAPLVTLDKTLRKAAEKEGYAYSL
jgi:predicted nucleic acid-binding protein